MVVTELFARVGIKVDPATQQKFRSSMDRAKGKLREVGMAARRMGKRLREAFSPRRIAMFATLGAVAVGALILRFTALGDEAVKTAQAIGLTTAELQKWRFAANLGGVSAKQMDVALRTVTNQMEMARQGSITAVTAFGDLGLTMDDLDGKSVSEVLELMAGGFQKIEDPVKRAAVGQLLLGRAGAKMAAFLSKGTKTIQGMRKEVNRFVSDRTLNKWGEQSAVLTDAQARLSGALSGLAIILVVKVQPVLSRFVDRMTALAIVTGEVLSRSSFLKAGFALLAGAALLLVAAFTPLLVQMFIASIPFILAAVGVGVLLLALEDFFAFLEGKDSVLGQFLDALRDWADMTQLTEGITVLEAYTSAIRNFEGAISGLASIWDEIFGTSLSGPDFQAMFGPSSGPGDLVAPRGTFDGGGNTTTTNNQSTVVNQSIEIPNANAQEVAEELGKAARDVVADSENIPPSLASGSR